MIDGLLMVSLLLLVLLVPVGCAVAVVIAFIRWLNRQ